MRVTQTNLTSSFIQQIQKIREEIALTQQQVSSGVRVNNPSDDPSRAGIISGLNGTLSRINEHKQRIAYVTNMLSQQESLVTEANNIMIRASEIATQAITETQGTDERAAMAEEIFALRDTLVQLANTKVYGKYIYAGADDSVAPFQDMQASFPWDEPGTLVTPSGTGDPSLVHTMFAIPTTTVDPLYSQISAPFDPITEFELADRLRTVNISDDQTVRVNSNGLEVFGRAINTLEKLGRSMSGYINDTFDPTTGLSNGDGGAYTFPDEFQLQTDALRALFDDLETARTEDLIAERQSIGARMSRVELAEQIISEVELGTREARSIHQDADIFDAASRLTQLQTSLEATLSSGVQLTQLSLLDFL
ncbi:MAG: flagellar hook-associated protein FlgL [Bdellovibrionales bacterium]|nr:flagellar hook-associated protein FlgL [Bdellovibrionales bacterium]